MTYSPLTQGERYQIAALFQANHSKADIARYLQRSPSTIGRELKRNVSQRGYRPGYAHKCSRIRSKNSHNAILIGTETWSLVRDKLRQTWSPEQISATAKNFLGAHVSHESIYQYIYADKRSGGNLHMTLRCQKKRKKRYGIAVRHGAITNAVSIDLRPKIVNQKERFADWEVDLVTGKNHQFALVTLNERISPYSLFARVHNKTVEEVSKMIITLLTPFSPAVHTITSDNGRELLTTIKSQKHLMPYASSPTLTSLGSAVLTKI